MTATEDRTEVQGRWFRLFVPGIILAGGLVPLGLYWLCLARVATVTPEQAKELLRKNGATVLVDVRKAKAFKARHIDGADGWPLREILATQSLDEVPARFKGKRLLLICDGGITSTKAARHLSRLGVDDVMSVQGGIQDWIGSVRSRKGDLYDRWRSASGEITELPFREASLFEQVVAVVTGFGVKATYTVLSLVLVIVLWRSRAADLAALRWAMAFFFVGENFCAANYWLFNEKSYLFEYLHSYGMLLCFGFTTYAVVHGMDSRIIMVSHPDRKCAALSLCGKCVKYTDAPCGLKRTFLVIIPACIILAFMPLCADWHLVSYNTVIFGTFYNYIHRVLYQAFEVRYCPIASMVLMAASLLILIFKKSNPLPAAKVTFAAGMGPLGFGMLRMVLAGSYSQNMVWFVCWEEVTELLFIAGVCVVLWIFRQGLFPKAPATAASAGEGPGR